MGAHSLRRVSPLLRIVAYTSNMGLPTAHSFLSDSGVFVQFCPADALLSPEPGGDQGTLFAHNMVQGYMWDCLLSFIFLCCICSTCFG